MKNYYHILGLSLDSNPDAELISQCHKALIKIFHPDVFKGDKKLGEKKVREINEAYEVLRDKKKRKKYDEDLQNYLNQQNKSSRKTDNSQQKNYKTDKDFNDTGFDNNSSEESRKKNPWAVLGPLVILIFVIVRLLSDDDSKEKVVSSPSSNKVQEYFQEYIQSKPVIEKTRL